MKITSTTKEFAEEYSSALTIKGDDVEIGTTLYGKDKLPRIISILGYKIDIAPSKQSLIFEYVDGPGRIGVIGTVLGNAGINITTMQIGTKPDEKCALVYVNIEGDVTDDVLQKIKESIDLKNLWLVTL
jgi:D-3-phosphoglycerate dehydrogenase